MSKLSKLEQLIKLNGDEEKYAKGLEILGNGNDSEGGGNARAAALIFSFLCIGLAFWFSPNLRGAIVQVVGKATEPLWSEQPLQRYPQPPVVRGVN